MQRKKQIVLKILVGGDAGVGKTTLLNRFTNGEFIDSSKMTVGAGFFSKFLELETVICQLQLWDVAGQERFRFLIDTYIPGARGALILYDTTSMTSFVNIQKWVQLVRQKNRKLPIIMVGTKADLEEFSIVSDYYAKLTQKKLNMLDYVKTSSKTGLNVDKSFEILAKYILSNASF